MSSHYLRHFFHPGAIAVVGASDRPDSVGARVFRNLKAGGFGGPIYPVNPRHGTVGGETSYRSVEQLPGPVDLAVVASPTPTLAKVVRQCGRAGIRAAVIVSSSIESLGEAAADYRLALLDSAHRYQVRLMGPACLGLIRPAAGLNATNSLAQALEGGVALVSQSAAVCSATLDWAHQRRIGFSCVATLGDALDVDFGDVLDYLATDRATRSILLYLEGLHSARRFMSGLRAAARLKPVVVVKAGRYLESGRAALSHTGALVGADDAFAAALGRTGAVRADSMEQLFAAAALLAAGHRAAGDRLAILTNGGGPGVIATDRARDLGLRLATLGPASAERLRELLPTLKPPANPVDLLQDADAERYAAALTACLADPEVDGVLTLLAPQADSDPLSTSEAVLKVAAEADKPVLASWMGGERVREARAWLAGSKVPQFDSPEAAVEAYSYLAQHRRHQQLLMQVPEPLAPQHAPNVSAARLIVDGALAEGRHQLGLLESKAVLTAFGIPVVRSVAARSLAEALTHADALGYPVAMKIHAQGISHKSSVGGVRLNLASAQAVSTAYHDMMAAVAQFRPDAKVIGVTLEPMHGKPDGREVIVGVAWDAAFGPVISFGAGGTMVELIRDKAVALPPLNEFIARDLIGRTRVAQLLGAWQTLPPIDDEALVQVLLKVSDLVCQLPQVRELDINPLVVDQHGALAVDARLVVAPAPRTRDPYAHMAILPYPAQLAREARLKDGSPITIRPIRPEDARMVKDFVDRLSPETRFFRFMETLHKVTVPMLVRFTQIDYDRELALVATQVTDNGDERQLAVARYVTLPDGENCEFAVVVADEVQGQGLGSELMSLLMKAAAERGLRAMRGDVLANNQRMLGMMRRLGFSIRPSEDDYTLRLVEKPLA